MLYLLCRPGVPPPPVWCVLAGLSGPEERNVPMVVIAVSSVLLQKVFAHVETFPTSANMSFAPVYVDFLLGVN